MLAAFSPMSRRRRKQASRLLRTRVASGARAIPGILSALESADIVVEAVTSHRPSLDDVYLHYTGRDFASDEEEAAA